MPKTGKQAFAGHIYFLAIQMVQVSPSGIENVTKVVVPKGTVIYEGTAAPQNILDSLGNTVGTLQGGGNQIYIPEVNAGWFK